MKKRGHKSYHKKHNSREKNSRCSYCGGSFEGLPHQCKFCKELHCSKHILPEDHHCKALERYKKQIQEKWVKVLKDASKSEEQKEYPSFTPIRLKKYVNEKDEEDETEIYKSSIRAKTKKFWWIIVIFIIMVSFLIIYFFSSSNIFFNVKNCSDGTLYSLCSNEKPLYCSNGILVNNVSNCGCPYDYKRDGDSCKKIQRCSDRTEYGDCSPEKPLYCYQGRLINKSSVCGCPYEYISKEEFCISKYQINPKNITFAYTLRGDKKTFDWEVYGGLNDYVADITRTISFYVGESEPTLKDFLSKNIDNQKQKEFLIPFINKIKNLSDNEDDRARIAISIVQNIPYDYNYSNELNGRYAYQVLYDNKGICGEKSPLLVAILREMGYGTAIINYGNVEPSTFYINLLGFSHEAVGIKCPLQYSYDNTGYCFIETTVPGIITDSSGDYPSNFCIKTGGSSSSVCTQRLPDNYTLTIISEGKSFDSVSEEYKDAQELSKLNKLSESSGGYLDYSDYYRWQELVEKYGIVFDNNY